MKKLTKAEKFLLENEGKYNSFRCPKHGVFQVIKGCEVTKCTWSTCQEPFEVIENAADYAKTH